jgi:asparagine synthase (glutamine-hydrolysing)
MKRLLPKMLYRMPKRGFPTPLAHWLRGELKQWVCERLLGPDSSIDLIFRKDFIADTLNQYLNSWKSRFRPLDEIGTHRIWMLLCLEGWLRGTRNESGIGLALQKA